MYSVSAAFKQAVYAGGTVVRPMIRFLNDNTFLTGEDIQLNGGLVVTEYFNTEEDLTIGCAPSSQLQVSLLNSKGYLNDYNYGECKVFLGAKVAETLWTRGDSICTAIFNYGQSDATRFDAYASEPYLTTNGEASNVQPPEALQSILIYGNTLYGIMHGGDVWTSIWDGTKLVQLNVDTWDDLSAYTWDEISDRRWIEFSSVVELSSFMRNKLQYWRGRGLWYNAEILYEFRDTAVDKYEYVPLGVFIADMPERRRSAVVNLTAQDRMKLFDRDASDWWNSLTFPLTVKQIFTQMCNYLGVPLATTGDFINSSIRFATSPLVADALTFRDILKWIAGGAGGYARFTRDGALELAWFNTQDIDIPANQYFPDYEIAEYNVPKITGMQILNASDDLGVLIGNRDNVYQMFDNPIFYGDTEDAIRKIGAPVYLRLRSFEEYYPIQVKAICNWAIQAGDVITLNGLRLPIFCQTITYVGGVKVTYQSTGGSYRKQASSSDRKTYQQKRALHQLQIDIRGIQSHIEDTDNNVADLRLFAEGLTLEVSNSETGASSTLTLKAGDTTLSSNEITLNGLVSFADLATAGKTTINGRNITTGQINADLITTGTLSADRIKGGTIDADYITVTNLSAGSITNGQFGSGRIADGAIISSKLGYWAVLGGNIATNAIINRHITSGSIYPSTCNDTINGYFADIIYANKVFAGNATIANFRTTNLWVNGLEVAWVDASSAKRVLGRY